MNQQTTPLQVMFQALERIEAGSKPITAAQGSLSDLDMAQIAREAIATAKKLTANPPYTADVSHIRDAEYGARFIMEHLGKPETSGGLRYADDDLIITTGKGAMLQIFFYERTGEAPLLQGCLLIASNGYLLHYSEPVRYIAESEENRPWLYWLNQLFEQAQAKAKEQHG